MKRILWIIALSAICANVLAQNQSQTADSGPQKTSIYDNAQKTQKPVKKLNNASQGTANISKTQPITIPISDDNLTETSFAVPNELPAQLSSEIDKDDAFMAYELQTSLDGENADEIQKTIPFSLINADIPQLTPPVKPGDTYNPYEDTLLNQIFDNEIPLMPKPEDELRRLSVKPKIYRKKREKDEEIMEYDYFPRQNPSLLKDFTLQGVLNLNSATLTQLEMLPMVDYRRGLEIIAYREQNGNFNKLIDIENVNGIDIVVFNKIFPYITTEGESNLKFVRTKK